MFEVNIPIELPNHRFMRRIISEEIKKLEKLYFKKLKVQPKFQIKSDRILIQYDIQITNIWDRVLETAIAYTNKFTSGIIIGIEDSKGNFYYLINFEEIDPNKYNLILKDANDSELLNMEFISISSMKNELSKFKIP